MKRCLAVLFISTISQGALELEVPVKYFSERHLDYLEKPGLLAVALENSGYRLTWSGRVRTSEDSQFELIRNNKFPFKKASLAFEKRKGSIFYYRSSVDWNLGVGSKAIDFQVAVDSSFLKDKRLKVLVNSPWLKVLPKKFESYVNSRMQSMARADVEQKLVKYLDGALRKNPKQASVAIFRDAYNQGRHPAVVTVTQREGDAEPVSDQIFVIVSVLLWLVAVPALFFRRWWLSRRV